MKKISLSISILLLAINLQIYSRYYNPNIGRFISADIETPGAFADLEGLNRYSYCRNNPVNRIDPTGNEDKLPDFIVPFACCTFEGDLSNLSLETKQSFLNEISKSLEFVLSSPPKGNSPINWIGNRNVLKGKSIIMSLTSSNTLEGAGVNYQDAYASTASYYNEQTKETQINIQLFIDNLFTDQKGNMRPTLSRLSLTMAALAHELYGNTEDFLEKKDPGKVMTYSERVNQEIKGHQAGIDFLGRFLKSSKFINTPEKIREEWRTELIKTQLEHRKSQESWINERNRLNDSLNNLKSKIK